MSFKVAQSLEKYFNQVKLFLLFCKTAKCWRRSHNNWKSSLPSLSKTNKWKTNKHFPWLLFARIHALAINLYYRKLSSDSILFFSKWSHVPGPLSNWLKISTNTLSEQHCNKLQNSAKKIGQFHIQFVPSSTFETLYDEEQTILISWYFWAAFCCVNEDHVRISDQVWKLFWQVHHLSLLLF